MSQDCDYIQGFHISRSLTPEDATAMIGGSLESKRAA